MVMAWQAARANGALYRSQTRAYKPLMTFRAIQIIRIISPTSWPPRVGWKVS